MSAAWAIAAATATSADTAQLPMRKAGLWQLTTVMDEGSGPKEHVLKMCVDAGMEQNTVQASLAEHRQNCSRYEVNGTGDAVAVDAECVFNGATVRSRTEMSGDFNKTFEVKIESTTVRTQGGQSQSVKRLIKQTGSYLGEACGDVGAGEAMDAGGNKIPVQ